MAKSLRIAFGSGRCADRAKSSNHTLRGLCARVVAVVEYLKLLQAPVLRALPKVATESQRIDGRLAYLTTYREELDKQRTLVVVQGYLPTWWLPTYISSGQIGHIVAEGLVVSPEGQITDAENSLMWEFR